MRRGTSLVAVMISAAFYGSLAVLAPLAYERGAQPLPLLTWRFILAAALLFSLVALWRRAEFRASAPDIGRYALLGLTGYGAASICFFYALEYADSGVVAVLLYTFPALIAIAEWAIKRQPPAGGQVAAVCTTFIGVVLVLDPFRPGVSAGPKGIVLGLGAAAGYALFSLLSDRWLPGRSGLVMMAWMFAWGALLAASATVVAALVANTAPVAALSPLGWRPSTWALLVVIVIVPTFAAVVLYLQGIRGLGPAQAAVISTLEPLVTIVLAWWVLAQPFSAIQIAGAVFVLVGVVLSEVTARRSARGGVLAP